MIKAAYHECGATPWWNALELHLPVIAAGAGSAPWHPAYGAWDLGQVAAQAAAAAAPLAVATLLALLAPAHAPLLSLTGHRLQGNRQCVSTSSPHIRQQPGENTTLLSHGSARQQANLAGRKLDTMSKAPGHPVKSGQSNSTRGACTS